MARHFHFWSFVALLCWLPLPLGSNRPWSWRLVEVITGALLISWAILGWFDRQAVSVAPRRIAPSLVLFSMAVAWGSLQTVSGLPSGIWHPLWQDASLVLGPVQGSISLNPAAGRDGVLRLLSYAGIFFLALQYARSPCHARWLVGSVAVAGSLYASYGLIAFISGSETILGMDKWAYRGMLTGTFVNRNNYATDAGLTILCLAALAIRRFSGLGFRGVLRRLLVDGDKTSWLLLIGGLITLTSLLFSGSRAGCAATLFGAIGLALALMRFEGGRLIFGIGSLAVMGLSYYAIQSDTTGDGSSVFDDRLTLYWVTLGAIGEHPWTGTGLGSFSAVYGMIRPETFLAVWDNVHNTYLQLILELGVVAALSQLVAIGWLVWRCARGARSRRRNQVFPALGFAASVLVGSHVLVDFSLEIPAIAGLYAALLGIGVAQSWSSADPTAEG